MVTIDARGTEFDSIQPSIRPYSREDQPRVHDLLDSCGGRYRVRRGRVVDLAVRPGLVAERYSRIVGLLTVARHREELEISALSMADFADDVAHLLIDAARSFAPPNCRRIYAVCSNAEFDVQRCLQQYGFQLCATRPGSVNAVARRSQLPLRSMLDGIPIRDEIEFDLLVS